MFVSRCLIFLMMLQSCIVIADGKNCEKLPGHVCTCKLDNGTLISLDALSGTRNPVFSDIQEVNSSSANGRGNYRYYYDPCRSFRLPGAGLACDGVSVCQKDVASVSYFNLGELGQTTFGWDPTRDLPYISYAGCYVGRCRQTNVSLKCDWSRENPMLEVFRQNPLGSFQYNMTLTSRCACPGGCRVEHRETHMGASSVFLLVLLVGTLLYLVVGVAFRRIVVGATGWEMIPNRKFWVALPGLIRDGVTYCITCHRADAAYDQI